MSEWWSYSLSDLLMFSARTYYRQFELMNREWWPLQVLALAAGGFLIHAMLRRPAAARQYVFFLLGMTWLWVAWTWHAGRYADINTGAPYFAAAFGVQGLLLAGMVLRRTAVSEIGAKTAPSLLAVAVALAALIGYPMLAPLDGRSWLQAEVFGIAPDPTCAATFGVLLFWRGPWYAWVIPLLWSAASAATLMALRSDRKSVV